MAEIVLDVIEQILVRLYVIDLLRCKSVCKSWLSLISSPLFVKAHLNYTCSINYHLPDRRIMMHDGCLDTVVSTFSLNGNHIVGSSNGLVCISPKHVELLVTNPLTREVNFLQTIPEIAKTPMPRLSSEPCWGFGYDSSADDYKVIVGFGVGKHRTRFHVLALKSNIWKLIGDIKYKLGFPSAYRPGILCEGSLHWFMNDRKNNKVIISFNLALEEFKEIPQPDDVLYKCDEYDILGFTEESLCIYNPEEPLNKIVRNKPFIDIKPCPRIYPRMKHTYREIGQKPCPRIYPWMTCTSRDMVQKPFPWMTRKNREMVQKHCPGIWIMRSYQVTQSWEQVPCRCEAMDVDPHYLRSNPNEYITHRSPLAICRSSRIMDYMATPIFVQSLVSPHGNITRPIKTTNDDKAIKRKRKRKHAKNSKMNAKSIKKDHYLAPGLSTSSFSF